MDSGIILGIIIGMLLLVTFTGGIVVQKNLNPNNDIREAYNLERIRTDELRDEKTADKNVIYRLSSDLEGAQNYIRDLEAALEDLKQQVNELKSELKILQSKPNS